MTVVDAGSSYDDPSSKRQAAALPAAVLPIMIAPKHEKGSPGPSTDSRTDSGQSSRSVALKVPRSRLPPRSRSGCWTCRTRKVKCDEQRPTCLQCSRLGHECDYGPRLSFRDDTPRVIERMQEVSASASHVWNPSASQPDRDVSPWPAEDLLPPFSSLSSDEERERKAELNQPGTFHVIANQHSFSSLPEYAEAAKATGPTIPPEQYVDPDDPNTVVLANFEPFEDPVARLSVQASKTTIHSPAGSTPKSPASSSTPYESHANSFREPSSLSTLDSNGNNGGSDCHLLNHYRSTISHHIIQMACRPWAEDVFEIQARTFLPLYHAMMALSALSLAHRNGTQNAEALEHYQKAIPAMRAVVQASQDSLSDGALLTHFLLLLYEIAAAEPWESNLWQDHIHQLGRIFTLRWEANGAEKHSFLIWMTCVIDAYALLSSSGSGNFVENILERNMLPCPQDCLAPLVPGQPQTLFPEEESHFPGLLQLNQEVVLFAFRVGILARDLRDEAQQRRVADPSQVMPEYIYHHERIQRIKELEHDLRAGRLNWVRTFPEYNTWFKIGEWEDNLYLTPRCLAICEHAYTLFRAVLIYLHTSMYPSQIPLPETLPELASCASDVLLAATKIVATGRFELRYIVFPLFMAGYATRKEEEKILSLELLEKMDKDSFGENTNEIRGLLEIVHQLQRENDGVVDWIYEMKNRGLNLVIFGF